MFNVSLFGVAGCLGVSLHARHQVGERHDPGLADDREFLHRCEFFCLPRKGYPKQIAVILRPIIGAKRSVFLLLCFCICFCILSLQSHCDVTTTVTIVTCDVTR